MEKRFLLFFVLSFLFLLMWNQLNPSKKRTLPSSLPSTQVVDSKEDASLEDVAEKESSLPSEEVKSFSEELEILENEKLEIVFSNRGGNIKDIIIKQHSEKLPLSKVFDISEFSEKKYRFERIANNEIAYIYRNKEIQVKKVFFLPEEDYLVHSTVLVENISSSPKEVDVGIESFFLDINKLDKKSFNRRDQGLIEYAVLSGKELFRKTGATKFSDKEQATKNAPIKWVSFRNRYFCAVLKPEFETKIASIKPIGEKELSVTVYPKNEQLLPGQEVEFKSVAYFGPQNFELLKSYNMGIEKAMVFFKAGFFDSIAKGILKLITTMHKFIPNWGVCIIITGALFYFLLYPLTIKSMLSMRQMQTEMKAVQPQITKIRERYKNNPQKLNEEMAKLYKEHNINPLKGCAGGCLPMFLQMPVFIGLYQVLWRSVMLKGADFLWIKDLSEPDKLFKLPMAIPVLGEYFNILPILVMIFMALQQRLSAKNMPAADPAQAEQQKMMAVMMPLMIGFFFYKLASGLCLYFSVFYLLSTLTQWKMSKEKKAA